MVAPEAFEVGVTGIEGVADVVLAGVLLVLLFMDKGVVSVGLVGVVVDVTILVEARGFWLLFIWVTFDALGSLENWVLPLAMGSTDLITAPEVTGKPAGVKIGGAVLLGLTGLVKLTIGLD